MASTRGGFGEGLCLRITRVRPDGADPRVGTSMPAGEPLDRLGARGREAPPTTRWDDQRGGQYREKKRLDRRT
jgi:hypothetical protein